MGNNNVLKTGLIGYGTGGEFFHAPFIEAMDEFELTAVLERTKEKSKERYPKTKIVRSIEELLSIEEIELIVITTPNDTHFELAQKSLDANKHVVLDKPFTVTSKESEALIRLAEKNKRILTVYHSRGFHSDFRTVQRLLSEKILGNVTEYIACYDRYRPELRPYSWKETERPGAGILYDLGSHLVYQALVLFGKPSAISAELRVERPGAKTTDYYEVVMHYENHNAILRSGMLVKQPGPVFKVTGTKAVYTKYGIDPQEAMLRSGSIPKGKIWAEEPEENWGEITINGIRSKVTPNYSDYRDFYRNIFNVIRQGEALEVSTEQAALVIQCIEYALQSNVENNAKISL